MADESHCHAICSPTHPLCAGNAFSSLSSSSKITQRLAGRTAPTRDTRPMIYARPLPPPPPGAATSSPP
eukprot:scaffold5373_cov68-Phaeocystis_antarctica.AAC.7